jgi:REP element-mobilizing transposase RayT
MGRPLRIEYPGAFYHVTSRGNERREIFLTQKHYERMIGYLESATDRYGAQIHCFCLMSNHYHLLLETPRGNLHQILHHLNTAYTNYFNAKTGRVGHLFQGRYRAILVDKDHYALELSRYIHLNPVRAHMVKDPLLYPWSSYTDYAGDRKRRDWVKTEWILGQISRNEKRARRGYRKFVGEASGKALKDPLEQMVSSAILGSEEFVDWVRDKWVEKRAHHRDLPSLRQLSKWPELSSIRTEAESLFRKRADEARRVALYLSHRHSGRSLGEIGRYFGGIGPSAVSQNTRRLEERLKEDRNLLEKVNQVKRILSE